MGMRWCEINLARQHPDTYARYLKELHSFSRDFLSARADNVRTARAWPIDEAIRFLQNVRPITPLIISPGISRRC
jgi:hypothetical protein